MTIAVWILVAVLMWIGLHIRSIDTRMRDLHRRYDSLAQLERTLRSIDDNVQRIETWAEDTALYKTDGWDNEYTAPYKTDDGVADIKERLDGIEAKLRDMQVPKIRPDL